LGYVAIAVVAVGGRREMVSRTIVESRATKLGWAQATNLQEPIHPPYNISQLRDIG
jgi:hypothetical protein